MDHIVFVCSGNIIRSAFCEIYARHIQIPYTVSSIGTTYHNMHIHPKAESKLLSFGVSKSLIDEFTPTHISEHRISDNALYLAMTRSHLIDLVDYGIPETHVRLITSLLDNSEEVDDPYFTGNYNAVFNTLKACVEVLKSQMNLTYDS